jgi:type 1 glutamine amidotransferase
VLVGAPDPALPTRPINMVLVAGKKDHGFGEHDYPRWQHVWSHLLAMAVDTQVSTAWKWPSRLQWKEADVLVFFKKGNWSPERTTQLKTFVSQGGGAVFIHWACESGGHAADLANMLGLASDAGQTKYRHGLIDLMFEGGSEHPITRGFETTQFHDESYWNLVGDPKRLNTLATCKEHGETHPLFWTLTPMGEDQGRMFVSIPGHYSWTFDDPLFRVLLLRGIAWSAKEPVDRFNNLIEAGIELR